MARKKPKISNGAAHAGQTNPPQEPPKSRQREMSPAQIRTYMEMAVQIMRDSVAEPRDDDKASPKVGAVLVKPDGTFTTACRGELRDGDHAEFTLLERKHRHEKLDGSVLFATLEPCAPGARNAPKVECARRIVLARIRKVWIGIEDPDPTVDRKGIKFLQDKGVEVRMFDRDLQEAIREDNKEFLTQALERAAAVEEEPAPVSLSPLEHGFNRSMMDDLSRDALEAFRAAARLPDDVTSLPFHRRLVGLGLAQQDGERFTPTGFGLLLFGKQPREVMPQAGLLGTIHYSDGTEETKDFDGPQVLVPEQAFQWLRDKLPDPIDRSEARRRGRHDALFEVAREGIVNALVHRDYDLAGAPVKPLTLEQMRSFNAPMLSRNPVLHYVFGRMELAEERGLGLKSMRRAAQDAGLPLPAYSWEDPYLVLRVLRAPEAATRVLPERVRRDLSEGEQSGWEWLRRRGRAKSSEYADAQGIAERVARRHLNHFVQVGLVRKSGAGPATYYEALA
jgi:ATP-dependent DNA helicase RecG